MNQCIHPKNTPSCGHVEWSRQMAQVLLILERPFDAIRTSVGWDSLRISVRTLSIKDLGLFILRLTVHTYIHTYIHTYTHKSSKRPYCLCHRVEIRVGCSTMCHPGQESKPFSLGRCLRADITAFFIPNFADNGPPLLDNFCQGKPERVHLQPFTLSSLQLNWRVNDLEQ